MAAIASTFSAFSVDNICGCVVVDWGALLCAVPTQIYQLFFRLTIKRRSFAVGFVSVSGRANLDHLFIFRAIFNWTGKLDWTTTTTSTFAPNSAQEPTRRTGSQRALSRFCSLSLSLSFDALFQRLVVVVRLRQQQWHWLDHRQQYSWQTNHLDGGGELLVFAPTLISHPLVTCAPKVVACAAACWPAGCALTPVGRYQVSRVLSVWQHNNSWLWATADWRLLIQPYKMRLLGG